MNDKPILKEEAMRLTLFIQRVLKMNKKEFAESVGRTPSDISKYTAGVLIIPSQMLRVMFKKWQYNLNWHFMGVGPMQTSHTQKKLSNDITDILASVAVTEQSIHSIKANLLKLSRDFYAFRQEIQEKDTKGTH